MLSSSPALLVAVFPFVNFVLAQELVFSWPKHPEANTSFTLTWSGGSPPYSVYVSDPALVNEYHTYEGTDLSTSYDFPLSAGTEVVFQCSDSYNSVQTSPNVTVLETLYLQNVSQPEVGVSSVIQWGGGLPPYTVYVLAPDQAWNYTGSETNQTWTPNMNPGTQVVFQVLDSNGLNTTSGPVTVQGDVMSSVSTMSVASTASVASTSSLSVLSTSTPESTTTSDTPTTSSTPTSSTSSADGRTSASGPGGGTYEISSTGNSRISTITSSANPAGGGIGGGNRTNVGAIAGGVAAGVVGLAIVGALCIYSGDRGRAGNQGGTQAQMEYNNYAGFEGGVGGQGEGGGSGLTSRNVGILGEYAPAGAGANGSFGGAGAGYAGIGSGVQGAGGGRYSFTPEIQTHEAGSVFSGAMEANPRPVYAGAADYDAGGYASGSSYGGSTGYLGARDYSAPRGQPGFPRR